MSYNITEVCQREIGKIKIVREEKFPVFSWDPKSGKRKILRIRHKRLVARVKCGSNCEVCKAPKFVQNYYLSLIKERF